MRTAYALAALLLVGCTDFTALRSELCAERPWLCVDGGAERAFCQSCSANSQCGPSNFCLVSRDSGIARCGSGCEVGCPAGSQCVDVADADGGLIGRSCLPASCDGG